MGRFLRGFIGFLAFSVHTVLHVSVGLEQLQTCITVDAGQKILQLRSPSSQFIKDFIPESDVGVVLNCAAIINLVNVRPENGKQAHGTGLARSIELASGKIIGIQLLFRVPDCFDFSVRGGIPVGKHHVMPTADYFSVPDDYTSERPSMSVGDAVQRFLNSLGHKWIFCLNVHILFRAIGEAHCAAVHALGIEGIVPGYELTMQITGPDNSEGFHLRGLCQGRYGQRK